MKKLLFVFCLLSTGLIYGQSRNAILKRKDCYFGLHFDFHATMNDNQIGNNLNEGSTTSFLRAIDPDFLQVDTKGHNGISSYPTNIGVHPPIINDPLAFYRKITAQLNIALYSHISGIIDMAAINRHPKWGRLDQSGEYDNKNISIYSSYKDSIFIPQLKELVNRYKIDGAWIDGDAWAVYADYNNNGLQKFMKASSIKLKPVYGDNVLYKKFIVFQENEYINYIKSYVNAIHQYAGNFQIGVNAAYSSIMPIALTVPVDYLTADIPATKDFATLELEARFLYQYSKPWDLMIWGFNNKGIKDPALLKKEVSSVISLGGAFELYFNQNRDASLPLNLQPLITDVAKYAKSRKKYCFKSVPVKEIGILYPSQSADQQKKIPNKDITDLYTSTKNILSALLDNYYQVDIINESYLLTKMNSYPVIILPEWKSLGATTQKLLNTYSKNGGKLLLIGADGIKFFNAELNVDLVGAPVKRQMNLVNTTSPITTNFQQTRAKAGTKNAANNRIAGSSPDLVRVARGKGIISAVPFDISSVGTNAPFVDSVLSQIGIRKKVELSAKGVRAILSTQKDVKVLNLINISSNNQAITVSVECLDQPTQVFSGVSNEEINFTFKNNRVYFKIDKLIDHEVVVIK